MNTSWKGYYIRGDSAESESVNLTLVSTSLIIKDEDNRKIVEWSFIKLTSTTKIRQNNPVLLRTTQYPGELLQVDDLNFASDFIAAYPDITSIHKSGSGASVGISRTGWKAIIIVIAILVSIVLFAPSIVVKTLPKEWAEELGESVYTFVKSDYKLCSTTQADAALDKLVGDLTNPEHRVYRGAKPQVRVINSPQINAMAMPGGKIVIFDGLIEMSKTAEDLAFVLAHELGHVSHNHSLRGLVRSQGLSLLIRGLSGNSISSKITSGLSTLAHSRGQEKEADMESLKMLRAANIRHAEIASFFERMEKEIGVYDEDDARLEFLYTHPASSNRTKMLGKYRNDTGKPAMSENDWESIRNMCGIKIKGKGKGLYEWKS